MRSQGSALRRLTAASMTLPLAIAGLLVGTAGAAHAAPDIYKSRFSGYLVEGYSSTYDGCTGTETSVIADEDRVSYYTFTYDDCAETYSGSFGDAEVLTFDVQGRGTSADVVAQIPLYDIVTGEPTGEELTLDNTWTAVGRAEKIRTTETRSLPGEFRTTYRYNATLATATVTGTIPLDYGRIGKASTTWMEMYH